MTYPSNANVPRANYNEPSPIGYQRLATSIGGAASLSVFRQFSALNTRNLLYLQAELSHLEKKLVLLDRKLDAGATAPNGPKSDKVHSPASSWDKLRQLEAGTNHDQELAKDLWEDVRKKLLEYNKALKHQSFLYSLKEPTEKSQALSRTNLEDFQDKSLIDPNDGNYVSEFSKDLVTPAPGGGREALTQYLIDHFPWLFQTKDNIQESEPDSPLAYFSEKRIRRTVRVISVIISSLLPIASVLALYFISSKNVRVGLVGVFTVICSTVLASLTRATNSEIIVATATYAAVLVVFISST